MSDDLQYELAKLKVGEIIALEEMEIMKVPNGWIFYKHVYNANGEVVHVDGTFVVDLSVPKASKKKPTIVVPMQ